MAQMLMGKLLPNLKITLGNDADQKPDESMEEGEIIEPTEPSDTKCSPEKSTQNVEIVRTWLDKLQHPKIYENKNGAFITGLDLSSEVVRKKLEERAARFGLEKRDGQVTQLEIDNLYNSLGIDPDDLNSCKLKNIRLDAIHMRGVDEMNTNEIFNYFQDYGPSSVEWINDFSCNVIWLDKTSAARALLGLSRPLLLKKKKEVHENDLKEQSSTQSEEKEAVIVMSDSDESETDEKDVTAKKDTKMETDSGGDESDEHKEEIAKEVPSVDVPVPPGYWRLGIPHPKAKAILLRLATKDDRKLPGAEKRSEYYKKYGNPNYGGLTGLISGSKKRKMQAARNRQMIEKFQDNEQDSSKQLGLIDEKAKKSKEPRMRMYADDEEEKKKNKRFKTSSKDSVYSRLGVKYTKTDLFHLGTRFSDSDEEDRKPVQRKVSTRFNVWTDIAMSMADEDRKPPHRQDYVEDEPPRDLRSTIKSSSRSVSPDRTRDLRSKLDRIRNKTSERKHRSPLDKFDK